MTRLRGTACGVVSAVLFLAVARAEGPRMAYVIVPGDELKLSSVSAIGRRVLRDPDDWTIGRSDHFLVFAGTLHEVAGLVDEAEYARTRAVQWFNLDEDHPEPALVALVKDDRIWHTLMRGYGLRSDSLAMQIGRELYFKDDAEQQKRPDRIAHEIIHLQLSDTFSPHVPLWLDEGLAGHYGWLCALDFAVRRDVVLVRSRPPLEEKDILPLEELLALRRYPQDAGKARAFYRQSEELTGVLADRLDAGAMARFVHLMCSPAKDRRRQFLEASGLDAAGEAEVVAEMKQRCLAVRKP